MLGCGSFIYFLYYRSTYFITDYYAYLLLEILNPPLNNILILAITQKAFSTYAGIVEQLRPMGRTIMNCQQRKNILNLNYFINKLKSMVKG